jgi:hypothetical protein
MLTSALFWVVLTEQILPDEGTDKTIQQAFNFVIVFMLISVTDKMLPCGKPCCCIYIPSVCCLLMNPSLVIVYNLIS